MGTLSITRKQKQGVWVGDSHIQIANIGANRVKVAITAKDGVSIKRDELVSSVVPVKPVVSVADVLNKLSQERNELLVALSAAALMVTTEASLGGGLSENSPVVRALVKANARVEAFRIREADILAALVLGESS
jgi:sRNA-binding carbon storage regulator CsrA